MSAGETAPTDEAGQVSGRRAAFVDRMTVAGGRAQHDLFVGGLQCRPIRCMLEWAS